MEKSNFRCKKIIANFKLAQNCRRRIKDCRRANVLRREFFTVALFFIIKRAGIILGSMANLLYIVEI